MKKGYQKIVVKVAFVTAIVLLAVLAGLNYKDIKVLKSEGKEFSSKDVRYGCYWGDVHQKKTNTPENWVLLHSGSRRAKWCDPSRADENIKKDCPDEKIINKMPGSPQSSYYIKNGERREISDYDTEWVNTNCTVSAQEVF